MSRTPRPGPMGSIRPPRPGEPIRAAYLRQEHRLVRRASAPTADETDIIGRFYAPSGGIDAPTVSGQEITPGEAECVPARWTGSKWVPDPEAPPRILMNSYPGIAVPGDAFIKALWTWSDHWEADTWSCPEG